MTRPQVHLVNNHLSLELFQASTRLTEGEQAILELLCTDSIYSIKDDFDKGFDERVWVQDGPVAADVEGQGDDPEREEDHRTLGSGRAFAIQPDYFGGLLAAVPSQRVVLMSRQGGWRPNRRATLMGRIRVIGIGNSKFEFGFTDADSSHIAQTEACVLIKDTPSSQSARADYAVIIRDTDDDTSTDLVTASARSTTITAAVGPVTLASNVWRTYMIALNEQNEARFYIDGIYAGVNRASARPTIPLWLWFMAVPRSGGGPEVQLDYIQAWQEREPI